MISRLRSAVPALFLLTAAYAADDPKPEAILDKFVEVTGGKEKYEKIKTEVATGKIEIVGPGLTGTLTSYREAPNKSYSVVDFEGMGKVEQGSNGEVAWSINPMEGPRVKEGDERAATLRSDAMHSEIHWHDFYTKAELAGSEDIDGKPCYKLTLTPKEGGPETRYFDKSSGLLVKVVMPVVTPQGAVTAEMLMADYKDEGGLLVPHTITQKLPGADILVKIESIKQNVEIPPGRFDLPADIKTLTEKGGDKKSEKK